MLNQLFVFNKAEQIVTILSNDNNACPIFSASQFQQALDNGGLVDTFTFSAPATHADAQYFVVGNYVGFYDADNAFQMYRIMQTTTNQSNIATLTAFCEHVFYELVGEPSGNVNTSDIYFSRMASILLFDTRWELGLYPESADLFSGTLIANNISVIQAIIDSLCVPRGFCVKFRLVITDGVIEHRYVDFLERRGSDSGKRFEFGKDIVGIKHTADMSGTVTALYGFGKGVSISESIPGMPTYEIRVDFSAAEWVTPGYPLSKPLGQKYISDPTSKSLYGPDGGARDIFGYVFFDDIEDANALIHATYSKLLGLKSPRETWEMTVVMLEEVAGLEHEAVRLGDTVNIINSVLNTTGTARVVEITRDLLNPTNSRVVLGTHTPTSTSHAVEVERLLSEVKGKKGVWDKVQTLL